MFLTGSGSFAAVSAGVCSLGRNIVAAAIGLPVFYLFRREKKGRLTSFLARNSTFRSSDSTWPEQVSFQGRVWTFCRNICHPQCSIKEAVKCARTSEGAEPSALPAQIAVTTGWLTRLKAQ